jgi:hypothetical protein
MNKYFTMALMCFSVSFCFAQVSVVTAPVLEAQAASQTTLITQQSAIMSTRMALLPLWKKQTGSIRKQCRRLPG